jgi:hypothetical protein
MPETNFSFNYWIGSDLSNKYVCSCVYKLTKVVKTNQIWRFR